MTQSVLWACVVLVSLPTAQGVFTGITTQLQQAVFLYPGQAHSERDLKPCHPMGVCSIIHRRFWLPPLVHRMCRCPDRNVCPWKWSGPNSKDPHFMPLNNRSQLKFCQNVHRLPICTSNRAAMAVTTHVEPDTVLGSDGSLYPSIQKSVTSLCYCKRNRYWQHLETFDNDYNNGTVETSDVYSCNKLHKCKTLEFCGNVRADFYSTYYKCSCPTHHLCLFRDKRLHNVTELLFSGKAYKGVCVKT